MTPPTLYLSGSEVVIAPPSPVLSWPDWFTAVAGSLYDSKTRTNRIPLRDLDTLKGVLRRLESLSPKIAPEVLNLLGRTSVEEEAVSPVTPYPFQQEGISFLRSRAQAMLLDDMGLGKTLQALLAIPPSSPTLVVCPRVARGVWEAEAKKIRPDLKTVQIRSGGFRWPVPYELVIMTYETVPESWELSTPPRGATLIVDEAHNVRNSASSRFKRIKALREEVTVSKGRAYLLTATPLENRPPDLWNLACLLGVEKEAFGTRKSFNRIFAYQGSRSWGEPLPEAAEALRSVALRRVKSEVQSQIPGKIVQVVPVEIELNRDEQGLADLAETWLAADSRELGFEHMMKARAMLAAKKIPAMLELIEDLEATGEQILVFSSHRKPIEVMGEREGWASITGEVSAEERTRLGQLFQEGKLKGLALTTGAGGTALTLTAAAHVVFVDREWNPSRNLQAEDRAVRIGQDKLVTIHRLIAEGTLDERVEEIIEEKTLSISGSVEAM